MAAEEVALPEAVGDVSIFAIFVELNGKSFKNMKTILLFQNFGLWEILIIALVILLIFGGRKIPELMKGLGKGVKSFKAGMAEAEKDLQDIKKDVEAEEPAKAEEPVEKPAKAAKPKKAKAPKE